ncbi:uncharacterized protein BT62DRAFT_1076461 [Guyanagaster necrorhizus]|uniref:Extracellular membrane protein CFEM domain-containing protein n=1 Tax=Guyanagaster necrorhizus TaxID=856835 RepID=A0A9P7VSF9_9AGAR|nr:uncharacterized protein BT62DRAFT_1076461 [Guyanagaster necrorhizus MCA 3950]KAG7446064.1 hypothetical protein BT62DRAFT_1076461 [Guyanagaster necrorhizus MCA 3950]
MSVMTLSTFLFLLLGVQLQTCVIALDPRALSWSRALHFVSRQDSDIPPQCQTPCSAAMALVSANCSPSECCTSSFENNYVACIECVGTAANITDYSQYQTVVDQLVVECSIQGIVIPEVTFPGQNANRPLSTSAIASSTSNTVSGTSSGGSTPISHSTISETSVITATSSISRSTITSSVGASSASVTERSTAPASTSAASAASGTASAASGTTSMASGTANSAVAMESEMLWMMPALVSFLYSLT